MPVAKTIAQAAVDIAANLKPFVDNLKDMPGLLEKKLKPMQRSIRRLSSQLGTVGSAMSRAVTGPLAAMGGAALASAVKIDTALKQIQIGTRASETAMVGLGESFRDVLRAVPTDVGTASAAIADLNTLTGATGSTLTDMATKVLDASRMLGEDGAGNAQKFGKFLNQWSIDAENAGPKIDGLFKLTQDFGIGLGTLLEQLNTYGPVLQNAGMSSEQAAEFMAKLSASGIAISRVMPGINAAMRKWAASNIDLQDGLSYTVDRIKNAKTETEALTLATNVFGAEGAQRLVTAIRNGAIELDNLGASLEGATGTIESTSGATLSFGDRLTLLKNNAMLAFEPIGVQLLGALEGLIPLLMDGAQVVADLGQKFADLDPKTQKIILGVGGLAAAIGPLALAASGILKTFVGLSTALPLAGKAVAALAGPVGIAAAAIASWGVVIYQVVDNWEILSTGTAEILGRIRDSIQEFIGQAISDVKGFANIGREMVAGLWAGIQEKLNWLKEKTSELASAIPDTLKKLLKISSPSKVTADIGKDVALGLVKGYDKGVKNELPKVLDEHLRLTKGKYEVMRQEAERQAEALLKTEKLSSEEREKVREWLRLKKAEITQLEVDDEKKKADQAKRDEEATLRERQRNWETYVSEEGTFAQGFKLGLDKMQADMVSWGDVGLRTFQSVTSSLEGTFKSFVDDAFAGDLKSAEDYFNGFAKNVLGAFMDMIAKMAAQKLTGAIFGGMDLGGGGGILGSILPGGGGEGGPGLLGAGGITDKLGFGEGIMGGVGAGIAFGTVAVSAAQIYEGISQASGARDLAGENRAFADFLQGLGLMTATADRWGGFVDMDKGVQLMDELSGFEDLLPAVRDFVGLYAGEMKEADLAMAEKLGTTGYLGQVGGMITAGAGLDENQINQLISQMLFSFKDAGMSIEESAGFLMQLMQQTDAAGGGVFDRDVLVGLERLALSAEEGTLGQTINQTNNISVTGLDPDDIVNRTADVVEDRLRYADRA